MSKKLSSNHLEAIVAKIYAFLDIVTRRSHLRDFKTLPLDRCSISR